jgi:ANTAR domain
VVRRTPGGSGLAEAVESAKPDLIIFDMALRRLIERAKALLMQGRKMTEPEAYRWLQKKAMNENRKLAQVVTEFLEQHDAGAPARADRKRP